MNARKTAQIMQRAASPRGSQILSLKLLLSNEELRFFERRDRVIYDGCAEEHTFDLENSIGAFLAIKVRDEMRQRPEFRDEALAQPVAHGQAADG